MIVFCIELHLICFTFHFKAYIPVTSCDMCCNYYSDREKKQKNHFHCFYVNFLRIICFISVCLVGKIEKIMQIKENFTFQISTWSNYSVRSTRPSLVKFLFSKVFVFLNLFTNKNNNFFFFLNFIDLHFCCCQELQALDEFT